MSLCIVILVIVTCLALALWQWQRGEQKQLRLDSIERMQQKGTLDWHALNALPLSLNKTGLQLQLLGQLDTQHYWLLDNKILQGRAGFDLLAIFYPQGGQHGLLVNFGWIAAGVSRQQLTHVSLPKEQITITVQLKEGDLSGYYLSKATQVADGWPKLIQYIDINEQQQQSAQSLAPFMAYSIEEKVFNQSTFAQPHYQPVIMSPEKHQAYALQWLLIAIAALIIFIFAWRQAATREQQQRSKQ